ncbi:MAG: AMP-binding protein [Planctomycetes bacterium]|nr:AMP-binding protein [Planctomycetota bacterium]
MTLWPAGDLADRDRLVALGPPGERTLGDLLRDAAGLAARLPAGPPGEVVMACDDRYLVAAAALAAWARGHAVALPPSGQPAAVERLAGDPAVRALVHDRDGVAVSGAPALDAREALVGGGDLAVGAPLAPARHAATVYTSGSTGAPLACRKTAGQLLGEAALLAGLFELQGARVVATAPALHIYGLLFGVLAPLAGGAAVCRRAPLHAEPLADLVLRERLDVLVSVPAHLRGLEVLAPGALARLSRVVSSGAPLSPETAAALHARHGLVVTEVFGSTETGGVATRRAPGDARWRPLPGVRVSAAPDGRLALDSPFLPPEAPRPWLADDLVEVAPDGGFTHLGRKDGVVKVGGKRVSLAEVERCLLAQPGVRDAAVVVVTAPGGRDQELVAAVAPGDLDGARLRAALRAELDPVVAPRRVHVVAALPREATGKLPRGRLLEALGLAPAYPGEVRAGAARGDGDERTVDVVIPADLPAFEGHFEGDPVLPGVFVLERVVLAQVRAAWPDLGALRGARRLKFSRSVRPGDALTLRLTRRATSVSFELARGGEACTSGALELAAVLRT